MTNAVEMTEKKIDYETHIKKLQENVKIFAEAIADYKKFKDSPYHDPNVTRWVHLEIQGRSIPLEPEMAERNYKYLQECLATFRKMAAGEQISQDELDHLAKTLPQVIENEPGLMRYENVKKMELKQ